MRALVGGRILTMEDDAPAAEAVVIRDGRIVFIGTSAEALEEWPDAEVVDLDGRIVLPGFIDSHSHVELTARATRLWVQVTKGFD